MFWFELDYREAQSRKQIICGIVYRTKYANPEIQMELRKFDLDKIILFGDFNSRTGLKSDVIECDEFIFQF